MKNTLFILIAFLLIYTSCSSTKEFRWTKETISKAQEIGLTEDEIIILVNPVIQNGLFS